jgi:glycosyltransferase involved in cell wall biosynthesis
MLVRYRRSDDPTIKKFEPPMDFFSRLRRRIRRERIQRAFNPYRDSRPDGYELFSDDRSEYGDTLLDQMPACDIVNLHWVARFLDYESFFRSIPQKTTVVWRLSDMNAFTGGCHYDAGCGKYNTGCGACPQLGSDDDGDLSRHIWERKRSIFERVDPAYLHFVAQSQWMKDEIQNSALLQRFPVTVIPNGLDIDVFAPRDQEVARDVLGIPQRAKVVLFVAGSLTNRRKGFALLANALERLHSLSGFFLLSVGYGKPSIDTSISHLHLGHLSNNRLLSLIYSAADLFAISSMQDNLPNTVLEAMSCGTPVVGFDVGGIPDMVRPGVTGLLAPVKDVEALRDAIVEILENPALREEMSENCRRIAVEEYALETQARRYAALYETLL